tara:strand:- start:525 stop:1001 length:477 start_codon:yes stop_codon:yes gene_type:complete
MNLKRNFIFIYIFLIILLLTVINLKNTNKVNINFFTLQSNNYSLGKLITYSFGAGLALNSLLVLLIIKEEKNNDMGFDKDETFQQSENINEQRNNNYNNITYQRPPERDIKDSQPTISVNYRVVENNMSNTSNFSEKTDYAKSKKNEDDDWEEKNNEW